MCACGGGTNYISEIVFLCSYCNLNFLKQVPGGKEIWFWKNKNV